MSVRIRMKMLGRKHRPFFRICAMERLSPRDGRVLEELGTYDPMIPETDARVELNTERIKYWVSVGAQPSDNVRVLLKKYGENGTHLEAQKAAKERVAVARRRPEPPQELPKSQPRPKRKKEEAPAEAAPAPESPAAE